VKRTNKRRMEELKAEVGVEEIFKETLVRGKLKCTGNVEKIGGEKLGKRADEMKGR